MFDLGKVIVYIRHMHGFIVAMELVGLQKREYVSILPRALHAETTADEKELFIEHFTFIILIVTGYLFFNMPSI